VVFKHRDFRFRYHMH